MMKYSYFLICFFAIGALMAFKNIDLKTFSHCYGLEGTWKMQSKRGIITEIWWKVNDTYMQNKSYMVKANGDTMQLETVALKAIDDGIYYTSSVPGQNSEKPVAFKLTASSGKKFSFQNPEHDFPKRIVYELVNSDSLHAYIDDGNDASNKRSHYYFHKEK